ncbi:hypothetical protein NQ318_008144 [Aromia moschata]|uniref:RNA-directed DNA polymerase n=1 Tax=Aromia moschata TaxID=1265417 RepID=A0AAV8YQ15_9CUCU|nr:hypothetical protein NQ318_008144 [Aromia moschata]
MERLAVQAFLDGLRDTETRQALTLARPSKLVDALARALEFEAAKESCRRQATIRKMEEDLEEGTCNEAEIRRVAKEILDKRPIRRWNGAKKAETHLGRSITVLANSKVVLGSVEFPRPKRWTLKTRSGEIRGTEERKQLIVPRNRVRVLEEIHNGSTGGHLGVTKTREKLGERFYWVNCTTDVRVVQEMRGALQFLHLFLLAYRSSIHETTGQTPASIVRGRELRLPCDLKFGCTQGTTWLERTTSRPLKETYDINANDGRYQPGQVWLYNPQRRRGLSPKLQSSWKVRMRSSRINEVVYRIQKLPRGKPRVVHFNRLAPFAGNNDEPAEARVRHVSPPDSELSFEEFMLLHSNGLKARYGVTREEPRDLFQAPADFCLAHCVAADLRMSRGDCTYLQEGVWTVGGVRRQRPEVGRVLQITAAEQEKERSRAEGVLLSQSISSLAIPKIASGLDGLDWRGDQEYARESSSGLLELRFWYAVTTPRRSLNEKTLDCFFSRPPDARMGFCRYRHGPRTDTIRGRNVFKEGAVLRTLASPPCLCFDEPAD